MIGIENIGTFIPETRVSNLERVLDFETSEAFVREKIGVLERSRIAEGMETSDLAVRAVESLCEKAKFDISAVECLVVVTQNPDNYGLPHCSAIVHGKLALPETCASFDVSLGCSGWVHALSIVSGFMTQNGMKRGILITADPYSKIIDEDDRDTVFLFGDGATATLLSDKPVWSVGRFDFGTQGKLHDRLAVGGDRKLTMNGRAVFTFSATAVPRSIERTLKLNDTTLDQIDRIVLHQGSRYIVDTVGARVGAPEKIWFSAANYGNTVSSSIPLILTSDMRAEDRRVIVSGFGVGLAWATTLLEKRG